MFQVSDTTTYDVLGVFIDDKTENIDVLWSTGDAAVLYTARPGNLLVRNYTITRKPDIAGKPAYFIITNLSLYKTNRG
jgi:hypothetical protein